jgi:hypothetical protein
LIRFSGDPKNYSLPCLPIEDGVICYGVWF